MTGRTLGWLLLIVVALTTIGCDRVTKYAATTRLSEARDRSYLADTVRLEYAENSGGFLSLGASLPPIARTAFFTVAAGLLLLGLVLLAVRRSIGGLPALGLTLFAAGGASNWIDRIVRGSVVDFMNVGVGSVRTGVFNVADVAILFGAGLFIVSELRRGRASSTESMEWR
ncbi:MAG: signal peptidase II [Vicinamibacterales bacterium]